MRRSRQREQTLGLGPEFADLLAREMEHIKHAAILNNLVNDNGALSDKKTFLGAREAGERRDRIDTRAAHTHKEIVVHRIAPPQEFDARALGIRDGLGGEFGIGDEEAAVNRARADGGIAGEDVIEPALHIERYLQVGFIAWVIVIFEFGGKMSILSRMRCVQVDLVRNAFPFYHFARLDLPALRLVEMRNEILERMASGAKFKKGPPKRVAGSDRTRLPAQEREGARVDLFRRDARHKRIRYCISDTLGGVYTGSRALKRNDQARRIKDFGRPVRFNDNRQGRALS